MTEVVEDIKILIDSKVQEGENLLLKLGQQFSLLDGRMKLERKIRSELNFLQKV